jgi:hypothetical protein
MDEWLIARAQRAYLWLHDWTGVYLATCAQGWRDGIPRRVLNVLIVSSLVVAVCMLDFGWLVHEMMWVAYSYLLAVKVRRRDPKEFFEQEGAVNER